MLANLSSLYFGFLPLALGCTHRVTWATVKIAQSTPREAAPARLLVARTHGVQQRAYPVGPRQGECVVGTEAKRRLPSAATARSMPLWRQTPASREIVDRRFDSERSRGSVFGEGPLSAKPRPSMARAPFPVPRQCRARQLITHTQTARNRCCPPPAPPPLSRPHGPPAQQSRVLRVCSFPWRSRHLRHHASAPA